MILLIVFLLLIVAVGAFAVFGPPARMFSPAPTRETESERRGVRTFGGGTSFARVPHLYELPQGCLIVLIFFAIVWFALWGIVLLFALRFLQTPYSG